MVLCFLLIIISICPTRDARQLSENRGARCPLRIFVPQSCSRFFFLSNGDTGHFTSFRHILSIVLETLTFFSASSCARASSSRRVFDGKAEKADKERRGWIRFKCQTGGQSPFSSKQQLYGFTVLVIVFLTLCDDILYIQRDVTC